MSRPRGGKCDRIDRGLPQPAKKICAEATAKDSRAV
jgi:hypothetical protein